MDENGTFTHQFAKRSDLGHIWVAVQTELLTYRRIKQGDPWLSSNFDLDALLASIQIGGKISMPLLDADMIQPYCRCGSTSSRMPCALREDLAKYYFGNLDVWDRTSFITAPERCNWEV